MAEFLSTLADVSTMWLVCLSFIFSLIPLGIVGAMVYGMHKLLRALPPMFEQGQQGLTRVADGAERASKKVAAPFITVSALASQVQGILRSLCHIIGRKE